MQETKKCVFGFYFWMRHLCDWVNFWYPSYSFYSSFTADKRRGKMSWASFQFISFSFRVTWKAFGNWENHWVRELDWKHQSFPSPSERGVVLDLSTGTMGNSGSANNGWILGMPKAMNADSLSQGFFLSTLFPFPFLSFLSSLFFFFFVTDASRFKEIKI